MIYSVYNYATKLFTYFETAETAATHAPKPPSSSAVKAGMGAVPEAAAWPLPSGAKRVGEGMMPKGRIATQGVARHGIGFGDFADTTNVLAMAGLAFLGWTFLYKKKR